jgi:Tol biopolymer transport system component
VAFVTDRDGEYGILVSQIGSHEFRSLSSQRVRYTLTDVDAPIRTVGFSWDGADVLLHAGLVRLQRIPLLGGLARSFLGEEVVNVDWSPDGTRLVYHHFTAGDPVFVSESDGTNETLILPSPEGNHQHYPIWSPDGEWIYLVRGRMNTGDTHLWRVRPDGSDLQRLTEDKRHVAYPAPIDARTVLFCAREPDGAGPWLWALDVESGESRRVSFGLEHYTSVSVSADGKRIVATIEDPEASLWRVPVLNRLAKESDVTPVPVPSVRALAPRFAGEDLYYLSSRGTGDGLWRYRDGESVEIWRGAETPLLEPPAPSPGGDEIALVLRKEANHRLHILSADGAELRALTAEVDIRGTASWSPDGGWLVAGGKVDGEWGLFKIPSKGGPAVRIASGEALSPVWSPAGDLIVYAGPQVSSVSPLLSVTPDGDPIELPAIALLREHRGERFRFLPDGKALIYMNGTITPLDFWLLDLVTMERRQLTQLEGAASMLTFDVTPDGEAIVFDRLRRNSDLVLIETRAGD